MTAIDKATQILTLAKSKDSGDRERLMMALAELCDAEQSGGARIDPAIEGLIADVFTRLIGEAERDIRQGLSERLSAVRWAPRELVYMLAADDIEIARPMIAQSPVLADEDLTRLLARAAIEHQIEVARRPCIGQAVVEAILSQAQPAVLTALADNDTAEISTEAMSQLVEASREIAAMRSPLVRHPKLTTELAERLYVWVGQSLRAAIVGRFRVDAKALDHALAQAVTEAHAKDRRGTIVFAAENERRTMERQLVGKLHASGQLKPGYLIKALREQRLSLFLAALSELANVNADDIERAIRCDRPELLALACTAAGVDRGAFSTILALVRQLAAGKPAGTGDQGRKALAAFSVSDPRLAAAVFKKALAAA